MQRQTMKHDSKSKDRSTSTRRDGQQCRTAFSERGN